LVVVEEAMEEVVGAEVGTEEEAVVEDTVVVANKPCKKKIL
jgi:hypothetical protein